MNGALWLLPLFAVGYALWAFSACGGWNATNRQTGSLPKTLPAGRRSSAGAALSSTRATPGHKLP